jgi:hypothetical protein
MALASYPTLVIAAAMDSPAIWHAMVRHDLGGMTALYRFLIAVPVAAIMLSVLRSVTETYGRGEQPIQARAQRLDETEPLTATIEDGESRAGR